MFREAISAILSRMKHSRAENDPRPGKYYKDIRFTL